MFQNVLWLNEICLLPVLLSITFHYLFLMALSCQMLIFVTIKQTQNWTYIQLFCGIQLSSSDFHKIPLKLWNYPGSHLMPFDIGLSKFRAMIYIYISLEYALMV